MNAIEKMIMELVKPRKGKRNGPQKKIIYIYTHTHTLIMVK
jgi:hypothetical protein